MTEEEEAIAKQNLAMQVSEAAKTILKDLLENNGGVGNLAPQRLTDALMTGILGLFVGQFEQALIQLMPTKIAPLGKSGEKNPNIPDLKDVLEGMGAKMVGDVIPVKAEEGEDNA